MSDVVKIAITNTCNTSNNAAQLSPSGKNQVHWKPNGQDSYTLKLPYGVFVGYETGTGTFDVAIDAGSGYQPASPLTLIASPTAQTISNYIYLNNSNCTNLAGDPPPEIVIDAN